MYLSSLFHGFFILQINVVYYSIPENRLLHKPGLHPKVSHQGGQKQGGGGEMGWFPMHPTEYNELRGCQDCRGVPEEALQKGRLVIHGFDKCSKKSLLECFCFLYPQ